METFTVLSTAHSGRGVYAARHIRNGETVMTCAPFAACVNADFRKEVCHWCFAYAFGRKMRFPGKAVGRAAKVYTYFCSSECAAKGEQLLGPLYSAALSRVEQAWLAHCRKHSNVEHSDLALAYRRNGGVFEFDVLAFIVSALVGRLQAQDASWDEFMQLQDNYPLLCAQDTELPDAIRSTARLLQASLPHELAALASETAIAAIVGRDAGNAFGLWQQPVTADSEFLGWAIYPQASFFNHGEATPVDMEKRLTRTDCQPNMSKGRDGREMVFTAMTDIERGSQLTISYGVHDLPADEKRKLLQQKWFFECQCRLCQATVA